MCTSFVWRSGGGVLVAMNFDNPDPYRVEKTDERFVVHAKAPSGLAPSFGVRHDGTFANHLLVDDDGQGRYRRASKTVTHTTRLVSDVLSGAIAPTGLDDYLAAMTVTNVPNMSAHCLVTDKDGNAWVVEPGRGTVRSPADESPFFAMTNFPLCDLATGGVPQGSGADRYVTATTMLADRDDLTVEDALKALSRTAQTGGDWPTAFSMVYAAAENAVYYCQDGDFDAVERHVFTAT